MRCTSRSRDPFLPCDRRISLRRLKVAAAFAPYRSNSRYHTADLQLSGLLLYYLQLRSNEQVRASLPCRHNGFRYCSYSSMYPCGTPPSTLVKWPPSPTLLAETAYSVHCPPSENTPLNSKPRAPRRQLFRAAMDLTTRARHSPKQAFGYQYHRIELPTLIKENLPYPPFAVSLLDRPPNVTA